MAKVNKNYQNFFAKAAAAGYGTNEIVSFLQNLFSSSFQEGESKRLQDVARSKSGRPDELSAAMQADRAKSGTNALKGLAKAATGIGTAGYAATQLPKVLSKAGPVLAALGMSGQEANREQTEQPQQPAPPVQPQEAPQAEPQQQENTDPLFQGLFSKYPELVNDIDLLVQRKLPIAEVGRQIRIKRKYKDQVAEIERISGEPLENLISRMFAGQEKPQDNVKQSLQQILQMIQKMKRNG